MFGALLRAAGGFAAGMVTLSLLQATNGPLIDIIGQALGTDSLLYNSLSSTITWLPVIAAIGVMAAFIARGLIESRLPGV